MRDESQETEATPVEGAGPASTPSAGFDRDAMDLVDLMDLDDDPPIGTGRLHMAAAFGLLAAGVPFVFQLRSTSVTSWNGEATVSSFDPIALGAGALALALALAFFWLLAKGRARGTVNVLAALAAFGLGAYHVPSGLGLFTANPFDDISGSDPCAAGDLEACVGICERGERATACTAAGLKVRKADEPDHERVYGLFKRGCELGSAQSCGNLGAALLHGLGVEEDSVKALEAFRRACELGDPERCAAVVVVAPRAGSPLDPDETRSLLTKACDGLGDDRCDKLADEALKGRDLAYGSAIAALLCTRDHVGGCERLHGSYLRYRDFGEEWPHPRALWVTACAKGVVEGCLHAARETFASETGDRASAIASLAEACGSASRGARCLDYVLELTRLPAELAVQILLAGCEGGADPACSEAGLHLTRAGPTQDLNRAGALFERACAADVRIGCRNAGWHLLGGSGGEADVSRARPFLEKACRLSSPPQTCFPLAELAQALEQLPLAFELMRFGCDVLNIGDDCAQMPFFVNENGRWDEATMLASSRKACEMDSPIGCRNLGAILRDGDAGATSNLDQALEAFRKSCDLEFQAACDYLGAVYRHGLMDQPVDLDAAARWSAKACALGPANHPSCRVDERPDTSE